MPKLTKSIIVLMFFASIGSCNNPAGSKNVPPVDFSGWWSAGSISMTKYAVQGNDTVKTSDIVYNVDTIPSIYDLRRDSLLQYYNAQACYSIIGNKITIRSNNDWYIDTIISQMGTSETVFDSLTGRDTTMDVTYTTTEISYFAMQSDNVTRNIKSIIKKSNESKYELWLETERLRKYPSTSVPANWPMGLCKRKK